MLGYDSMCFKKRFNRGSSNQKLMRALGPWFAIGRRAPGTSSPSMTSQKEASCFLSPYEDELIMSELEANGVRPPSWSRIGSHTRTIGNTMYNWHDMIWYDMYTYIYIYLFIYLFMYLFIYLLYKYTYMYMHICICTYVHLYICTLYIYIYIYIYIYTYIYIYIRSGP